MARLRGLSLLLLLPSLLAEISPSIDLESLPRPVMPTSCHMVSCMPGMVCRMTEPAICKSPPCDSSPTCVEGESDEETTNDEGTLNDPIADDLGEHSTSPEEPVRRIGPMASLSSNWTRGGSAPLLDVDTTKLMKDAKDKLMRAVMHQQPSPTQIGEFIVDLVCLIRGSCQCNANERYVTCGSCEGTCDNQIPFCPDGCRPARCECLPGFVRFTGVCIPARDCPGPRGPWVGPGGGPRPGGPWPGRPGHGGPRPGGPRPGGPRPPGGPWAPGPPGSQNCRDNEEWDLCGTQCESSCLHPNQPPCPPGCAGGSSGCRCRSRFVRHWDGQCRPPNWCSWNAPTTTTTTTTVAPNVCPPYQRFMLCGSRCEPTCNRDFNIGCGAAPSGCAPPRCECIPGYVRWNNQCIPAASCTTTTTTQATPICGRNEVFKNLCSSPCEPSCYSPNPNCGSQCSPPSCQCAQGYYRRPSPYNDCVSWSQCAYGGRREEKPEECRENEEYKQCTKQCEATCFDRNPKCVSKECGPPGCECSPGFLRVSVHESVCIPPSMCPAKKTLWRRS